MDTKKSCFVICPIGAEGSPTRRRSDQIWKHVIAPITETCGYTSQRADTLNKPGIITSQIIEALMNSELVVADLTAHNPNVLYELGIRHAFRKPVIQLIDVNEDLIFDVKLIRTIKIDHNDLDSVANCKEELRQHILEIEKSPDEIDSPVTAAVNIRSMLSSGDPVQKSNAEILELLSDVKTSIDRMSGHDLVRQIVLQLNEHQARLPYRVLRDLEICIGIVENLTSDGDPEDDGVQELAAMVGRLQRYMTNHHLNYGRPKVSGYRVAQPEGRASSTQKTLDNP